MKKNKVMLSDEAMERLRDVLYGDDDLRSFNDCIHHILNELEQRTAELEAELETTVEADPYLVRTYGKLNEKDISMLQLTIGTDYTNASRKSRFSKKDWRELGARFGLELTE